METTKVKINSFIIYLINHMSKFEEVKKMAKDMENFREIIRKAPGDYKAQNNLIEMDENNMTRE